MKVCNTSDRLKQIMKNHGLRQVDILEAAKPFCEKHKVKLGKTDLSQYVSGKVEPGQDKLLILSLALGVSETWLMGYDVPTSKQVSIKEEITMARETLSDMQVEEEIIRLQESPYVKLANKERRVREKRRMYLYHLRQLEKKGRALEASGITSEVLDHICDEQEEYGEV